MRPLRIRGSYIVRFGPDGRSCATIGRDVSLWDVPARKKRWRSHPFSHPSSLDFSPDGSRLAVKSTSGRIAVLDAESGDVKFDLDNAEEGEGAPILFAPDGEHLIDGSWAGLATVRAARSGRITWRQEYPDEMIVWVAASRRAASWFSHHQLKSTDDSGRRRGESYYQRHLWPPQECLPERMPIDLENIVASALHPDADRLGVVFGRRENTLAILDVATAALRWRRSVAIGGSGVNLNWSGCGGFVSSVQKDRIAVYDGETGDEVFAQSLAYPCDAAFSPDGSLLALGSWQDGLVTEFTPRQGA